MPNKILYHESESFSTISTQQRGNEEGKNKVVRDDAARGVDADVFRGHSVRYGAFTVACGGASVAR